MHYWSVGRFIVLMLGVTIILGGPTADAFPVPEDLVDTTAPRVSLVRPTEVMVDVSTVFMATVTDDEVIERCDLFVNEENQGRMTVYGTTASRTDKIYDAGSASLKVSCSDEAGNVTFGPITTVTVSSPAEEPDPSDSIGSNEPPSVGRLTPTSATVDIPVTFSVSVSDDRFVERCDLYIENEAAGRMAIRSGVASMGYVFYDGGQFDAKVRCEDGDGEASYGRSAAVINVEAVPTGGQLIKMDCGLEWWVNHPCTTVYYLGEDGYRHPFVNEKTFFSWYEDYDDVEFVSKASMQAWEMGENVTYKPGSRLVKFPTDKRVFVVGRGAILYPLDTETVARHIWGRDWTKAVEDISDVFYRDYEIGPVVLDDDDWDNDRELRRSTSPMVNF